MAATRPPFQGDLILLVCTACLRAAAGTGLRAPGSASAAPHEEGSVAGRMGCGAAGPRGTSAVGRPRWRGCTAMLTYAVGQVLLGHWHQPFNTHWQAKNHFRVK